MAMKRYGSWKVTALAAAWLALGAWPCVAQGYPDRPIKLIMPYAPGGIIDFTGRKVAQYLAEALGQPVVAENHPGAGGMLGTSLVAHGTPDGYAIVIMDPAIVINPTLQPSVPYDLFKQLATVSIVTSSPEVLVVAPQLPIKSVAEFIAYAKANPGKLRVQILGLGTQPLIPRQTTTSHCSLQKFRHQQSQNLMRVEHKYITCKPTYL